MTGPDPSMNHKMCFMQGAQPEDHFMVHGGGQALSFYRAWLWLEQACIEAVYLELLPNENKLGICHRPMAKRWKSCVLQGKEGKSCMVHARDPA